jgi:adenylate cyclase
MKNAALRLARALASRRTFGLVLLAALVLLRIGDPYWLQELRLRSFDLYQKISPRAYSESSVVIVDIDEDSLSTYGQWPWPRTLLADLLTRLYEWQVAAIGFDVVFAERDRTSPDEAVKNFRNLDEGTREILLHLPNNDEIFAKAIAEGRVVLGQSGAAMKTPAEGTFPETGIATMGPDPSRYLIGFPHLLRNIPVLEQAAAGRGLFSILPEQDGIVRRVPIVMMADDKIVPALTLDLLRVATGSSAILVRTDEAGVSTVAVPGLELPTDRNGRIWVHYARHDKARYVSAKDILEGKAAPERFAGKLALVGPSAIGLLDVKTTPVSAAMPGVEVHAQLLEAALTDSLLGAPGYAIGVEMTAALVGGVALSLLAPIATALTLFATAVLMAGAVIAGSWVAYSQHQMLFDATFPVLALLSVYISVVVIGYFREQLDRRRIRLAFGQYLSPTLVERLAKSSKELVLGGEDRNMTVLFSDVRGFTAISESYKDNPQGLTALMNHFLTPVTNAIIARNGTIDKYMGDAVMAFWNAPLDDAAQESDACHAALDMLERVDALNQEREREASAANVPFIPIFMGIGINTGRCTVGNMGSDLRFQYTVMGDTVNVASRLEGQTRTYDLSTIIGSRTAAAVADEFALLEIDSVRVKGKAEPEVIYTILGRADLKENAAFMALRQAWENLRLCYRKQDWAGARKMLDACRSCSDGLHVAGLLDAYATRIDQLEQNPPEPDWDGVYTAESK